MTPGTRGARPRPPSARSGRGARAIGEPDASAFGSSGLLSSFPEPLGVRGSLAPPASGAESGSYRRVTRWRRGWDSNPRGRLLPLAAFQATLFNHSSTSPCHRGGFAPWNPSGTQISSHRAGGPSWDERDAFAGGEGGIRTRETIRLLVFETSAFNRSATSPPESIRSDAVRVRTRSARTARVRQSNSYPSPRSGGEGQG
jgi:hypothetical protein